jgi:transcription initiation factor TFIIIB Brf1 subunit/transcription initiation factor TFIIB
MDEIKELNESFHKIDITNNSCGCGCSEVISEDNMQICKKCSSIVSKLIENTAEWRFYGNDDNRDADPSRCGLRTNNLLPFSSIINIFFRYSGDIIISTRYICYEI